ncbi:Na+/H+ antiporter NhaA [Shewanella sp. SR43-4]|nr:MULTISPECIES: Na+/H+ antiporter NhaA [Shewanella]MBB1317197.1 Na+/H+ antiporter NhaA [Shewanella sp. SR43-4]MBB1322080.1 Na+/H+ antiporter NhaA [Shewanella sp. SR43-8]RPA56587.1 Na+/H+ antiporter NhaA [Shewanella vesiculosa]UJL43667.1 Na+/H+ antiporter NhaA [Shewanella vesiculosa]|tara:strand:+ start:1141 stop:2511 length:1371 start_codon:yes stop_codon:yes gene_type:complete
MSYEIKEENRDHAPLERGFLKFSLPVESFINSQIVAGIVLLVSAIAAILMVNLGWQHSYEALSTLELTISLGDWAISHSLHYWINDGLMVLFFFILGLEIKYECLVGALSDLKDAGLVIVMALGGMVLPALIYSSIIWISESSNAYQGWGVPMATDTAFAIGILTLLGAKAPRAAYIILTGLAIVDDMGAVAVIGLFYTDQIIIQSLLWAGLTLLVLFFINLLGIRKPVFYLVGGFFLWWFILQSGVHATTAGLLAAMMVPTRPYTNKIWFRRKMQNVIHDFKDVDSEDTPILENEQQHALAVKAEDIAKQTTAPILRWGYTLDKPVSLIILPLFAFLNAGVMLPTVIPEFKDTVVTLAIILALVLGKGIGISFFAWLGLKVGAVRLPDGVTFSHIIGIGFLAGVGFTMSLFISVLAFEGQPALIEQAKLGILFGSLIAGIIGAAILFSVSKDEVK